MRQNRTLALRPLANARVYLKVYYRVEETVRPLTFCGARALPA